MLRTWPTLTTEPSGAVISAVVPATFDSLMVSPAIMLTTKMLARARMITKIRATTSFESDLTLRFSSTRLPITLYSSPVPMLPLPSMSAALRAL